MARFQSITKMPNKNHNKVQTPSFGFSGPSRAGYVFSLIHGLYPSHSLASIKWHTSRHSGLRVHMHTHTCTVLNTVYWATFIFLNALCSACSSTFTLKMPTAWDILLVLPLHFTLPYTRGLLLVQVSAKRSCLPPWLFLQPSLLLPTLAL